MSEFFKPGRNKDITLRNLFGTNIDIKKFLDNKLISKGRRGSGENIIRYGSNYPSEELINFLVSGKLPNGFTE